MKALILNSGMGSRMGVLTKEHPKCMTDIPNNETILSRQLRIIEESGLKDVVITTGYYDEVLVDYCNTLNHKLNITFVKNPIYAETNYIYSIYCAKEYLDDDIILMHGDLVYETAIFNEVIKQEKSCMTVSSTLPLPEKDFKAVMDGNRILKVGIEFFDNALAAQPLYKLNRSDWRVWLNKIAEFCESEQRKCYAENAFNVVSDKCEIYGFDFKNGLCAEIDTYEDLLEVSKKVECLKGE
ncbi:MAG: phosphocholine cytidylyltransferase family protein [Clostridia bacterium]|nr:phosphocholine cytidylyltransferase family protein [Clostridia bacterium]